MYKHIKEMLQSGQVIHVEFTKKNGDTWVGFSVQYIPFRITDQIKPAWARYTHIKRPRLYYEPVYSRR